VRQLHARGKKIEHRYESLRFCTAAMNRNYEYQLAIEAKAAEMARHMALVRAIALERRHKAATAIQKVWRARMGRAKGRELLRAGRRRMREQYRQRKQDDAVRRQRLYRLLDFFGRAPRLASDSKRERVLKHFPVPLRGIATRRIEGNLEFAAGQVKDRKKVPKRGFEVGTVEELVAQAWYGGTKLPGFYMLKEGERVVYSTADLREVLGPRSRVRVGDLIFHVDPARGVTAKRIYLSRLWRRAGLDRVALYRMPELSRPLQQLHDALFVLCDSTPAQLAIEGRAQVEDRIASHLRQWALYAKWLGMLALADYLDTAAGMRDVRARRIRYLLLEFQHRVPLDEEQAVKAAQDNKEAFDKAVEEAARKRQQYESRYMKKEELMWEDGRDPRSGKRFWTNKKTGEVTYENPLMKEGAKKEDLTVAQQKLIETKAKMAKYKQQNKAKKGR
jgi:hypothetical protein